MLLLVLAIDKPECFSYTVQDFQEPPKRLVHSEFLLTIRVDS